MKVSKYHIKGEDILKLTNMLKNIPDINQHFKQLSETSFIFANETYYFRISSDLLSIVILNFVSDNECEIEIISGGGKEGLLSISWGAESSRAKDIYIQLENICKYNSWTIEMIE